MEFRVLRSHRGLEGIPMEYIGVIVIHGQSVVSVYKRMGKKMITGSCFSGERAGKLRGGL